MPGISDVVSRIKDKKTKYEESYFGKHTDKLMNIRELIKKIKFKLEYINCKVVLIPITTMNLSKWNGHRLQIGRTKILKYKDDYEKQHILLNEIIYAINCFKIEQNVQSGIVTPFLHSYVHKNKGAKIRYVYSKLVDGVHPSDQLALLWKQQLQRAMHGIEQKVVVD